MPESPNDFAVNCFLLKVASRCNINCDYCYMYNHLDQSWKLQPKLMSDETLSVITDRISEYVLARKLDKVAVVYHGGEPLLMSTDKLVNHAEAIKKKVPGTLVEFSLQTNGVLLNEEDILKFKDAGIQVSLSLDGPEVANNRHRLDHKGLSSFEATERALTLLEKYPNVFSGVIAVIDIENDPNDILKFFAERSIPQLDFLLPDANYLTLPPGISDNPDGYLNWLITCFDAWFDFFPWMKIRTFDAVLASLMGIPSDTDGFGLGDVSLITIETDGSYHDLDVLKITGEGTCLTNENIYVNSIDKALQSEQISRHRQLLKKEGLSEHCQNCSVVDVCGGGAVAHRFGENGFQNPSIYCKELKGLIEHARKRVIVQLQNELDRNSLQEINFPSELMPVYEASNAENQALQLVLNDFKAHQSVKLRTVIKNVHTTELADAVQTLNSLNESQFGELAIRPSIVTWTDIMQKDMSGISVHDISGRTILPDPIYIKDIAVMALNPCKWPAVQREDKWLRVPFAEKIFFESNLISNQGTEVLVKALKLIENWKPSILEEMNLISPEIQFIRDLSAHPDKVVSFSDNSVPGALYVQLMRGNDLIDSEDLADSIIHEHRHQKLYMLQRVTSIVNKDYPLVVSPWREELRPPTGLFHALFVFVELLDFWSFLSSDSLNERLKIKANIEMERIRNQLKAGFKVVQECDLTSDGRMILEILYERYLRLSHENNLTQTSTAREPL